MPPSGKRGRAKREAPSDDNPHTSPSRPSKRKRASVKETIEEAAADPPKVPREQKDLDLSHEELVAAVTQHLLLPNYEVQVALDNNNEHHQRQSQNVQAFAKICGRDWTYYVKLLRTNIGRPPEGVHKAGSSEAPNTPGVSNEGGLGFPGEETEPSRTHVDLGPSKLVSRLHAEIFYNQDDESWNILVNGRNSLRVDSVLLRRGQQMRLTSGNIIEIAGVEMMFVLPENQAKVEISPIYLSRAGLIVEEFQNENQADTKPPGSGARGGNLPGVLPIAPAPPDYRRPDTPVKQRGKGLSSKSPYGPAGGTMLINSNEVDLSADSSMHIKPSYTYSQLITQALMTDKDEKQTLNSIYKYISDNYAFYRQAGTEKGWQNSIRHNLSLNNGFKLRPRNPDEPGKGGYWGFTSDRHDDLIAEAWGGKKRSSPRGESRNSSASNSPGKDKKPRTAPAPGDVNGGSPTRKVKRSPPLGESPLIGFPSSVPQFTPDRRNQLPQQTMPSLGDDGSPLPRRRGRDQANSIFGMSDNIPGSPPVISSSFAQDDGTSFATPAPRGLKFHLAPPSTAQRPSQHMPTSSPAPFWKYVDAGTPIRPFDISPSKDNDATFTQSSSPVPRRDSAPSPSRSNNVKVETQDADDGIDEDPGFDLMKGFMKISKYHTQNTPGLPLAASAGTNGRV